MVQHTLVVKNVANTGIKADLAKELGDANKIVAVQFKRKKPTTKSNKYALVTVETEQKEAKDVAALLNNKTVAGKQLQVTVAKAPHERKAFVDRVARLKKLEQYSSVWPARNYKNVSSKDPRTNYNHVLAGKHGRPTRLGATKSIQKTKTVPSRALHLSGIPSNVNKKQILEALKEYGPTRGRFSHNGKKASYGFVFFKTPEARAKAQAALKAKKGLAVGDATIKTAYANRYGKQNVYERRPKAAAPKATQTKA